MSEDELFNQLSKNGFSHLKIEHVMSKPVFTVSEDSDLSMVEREFIKRRIRHMPVVDGQKRLVGIISQRDLYRTVAPRKNIQGDVEVSIELLVEDGQCFYDPKTLEGYILSRVMRKNPETLTSDNSVKEAVHLMVTKKMGGVPVINERREVTGIITRHDIMSILEIYLSNATLPDI
ncbi:MAG: CBS domain-containing protein [Candidatus Omnitrophica bacterium]|nr:CBS domain-containing protein [Candidatus Omnitrophota bacterium]